MRPCRWDGSSVTRRDDDDGTVILHVGDRGGGGLVKVGRIPATMTGAGRRHVDIAFAFPKSRRDKNGYRWECMSRTQARVLAKEILEAAK